MIKFFSVHTSKIMAAAKPDQTSREKTFKHYKCYTVGQVFRFTHAIPDWLDGLSVDIYFLFLETA
jgi:hypothetical protein